MIRMLLSLAAVGTIAGTAAGSMIAKGSSDVVTKNASRASTLGSVGRATETAVFAGGCFWGVEAVFEHVKGVTNVVSGYAGGTVANPDYDVVSSGRTGHAEAVRVTFDPAVVSYNTLLDVFFTVAHDPTQLNRQGPDVGTQYRSAVFTASAEQEKSGHGVRGADGEVAQIQQACCHTGGTTQSVLHGGSVSPRLSARPYDATVHRLQRLAKTRRSEKTVSDTVDGERRYALTVEVTRSKAPSRSPL